MKIAILGWYGHKNVGDEAILEAMLRSFSEKWPGCIITVHSRDPQYTTRMHNVNSVHVLPILRIVGIWKYCKALLTPRYYRTLLSILRCDLFVLGGGGLLSDRRNGDLVGWLKPVRLAKLLGKTTEVYRIGAGPFLSERGKQQASFYINRYVDHVSVRDRCSYDALIECGVDADKLDVWIDPVAEMDVRPYRCDRDEYVSVIYRLGLWDAESCKQESLERCFIAQVDTLIARKMKVRLLFFHNSLGEQALADRLRSVFGSSVEIVFSNDFRHLIRCVAASKAVISMRLHGSILAYAFEKPFLPIVYHTKMKGFLEMIDYRAGDMVLDAGDGISWPDAPIDVDRWTKQTNRFVDLLMQDSVSSFYEKHPSRQR